MENIKVKGMTCEHCKASVTKAVSEIPGVISVDVDLLSGRVTIDHSAPLDMDAVQRAVFDIGFEVE